MKVNMMKPFRSFSGTMDELVYSAFNEGYICFSRDYVIPAATAQNETVGDIATNLGVVYDSFDSGWIDDLKTYTRRYGNDVLGKKKRHPAFYALYSKMWWAVNKDDPTIDLKTVTFADISLIGISIQTVKEAIDYGYLPKVNKYDDLTHTYNGA
jgi:hypothetical protein